MNESLDDPLAPFDQSGAVLDIVAWLGALGLERYAPAFEANDIDAAVLRTLRGLRARLERAGQPIGGNDPLIAAHAIALRHTLVTDHVRAFARLDDLPRTNWLHEA